MCQIFVKRNKVFVLFKVSERKINVRKLNVNVNVDPLNVSVALI